MGIEFIERIIGYKDTQANILLNSGTVAEIGFAQRTEDNVLGFTLDNGGTWYWIPGGNGDVIGNGSGTTGHVALFDGDIHHIKDGGIYLGSSGTSSPLLAIQSYNNATETFWATLTNTSIADFDATNAAVTFIAPLSGNVLVKVMTALQMSTANSDGYAGLRESTTEIASRYFSLDTTDVQPFSMSFYLSGISPGSHTYKFAGKVSVGSLKLYGGGSAGISGGQFIMEVWACP